MPHLISRVPIGDAVFVLPEIEHPSLVYLGISGEELGEGLLIGNVAHLQLASVLDQVSFPSGNRTNSNDTPCVMQRRRDR